MTSGRHHSSQGVVAAKPTAADAPDVTGETYGAAVQILKYQGYKPVFAGSIGKDLPAVLG